LPPHKHLQLTRSTRFATCGCLGCTAVALF